jgi:DNA-binding transcriptional LysR family regulator
MNYSDILVLLERYMELSDLRIFTAVVREGGVTRAAERLHRVQSNVTTRIRQLEDDLGVALFIREGKRLRLAPAGQVLLDYADRLLGLANDARGAVHDARSPACRLVVRRDGGRNRVSDEPARRDQD